MFPLHQSYIRRLTTQPALKLIDTVSWCTSELVHQKESKDDCYVRDSLRNHKCNDSINQIGDDDEDTGTKQDGNITLWDLRKNLENNIVVFRNDNQESYHSTNGSSVKASKKPQKLKDMKGHREWFGRSINDPTDDYRNDESDRELQFESLSDILLQKETEDFDVGDRDMLRSGLSRTVRDIDFRPEYKVFDSSSSSVTPDSLSSESTHTQSNPQLNERSILDATSKSSKARSPTEENASFSPRHFRRSTVRRQHTTALYYGYSLERDFCVDSSTDRLFKEFISPRVTTREIKRGTLQRSKATQLRRQLMRKQYSDTAAVYYGQRMRRWRMQKQRSDSINCPVDRGVLRRQGRIQEEFFCDEMEKDQ